MEERKKKTFLVLKPIIIQDFKQQMIDRWIAIRQEKRKIKILLSTIVLMQIMKKVEEFLRRELRQRRNRQLTIRGAAAIKMYLSRFLQKRGQLKERQRGMVRHSILTYQAMLEQVAEQRAQSIMYIFLLKQAKEGQFIIKMKLLMSRMLTVQKQGRLFISQKKMIFSTVISQINKGLSTLQQAMVANKQFGLDYKSLLDTINVIQARGLMLI